MHCGGVRKDRFDISKIYADRDGASTLEGALLSKFDEALAIKFGKAKMPESLLQEDKACGLGTPNFLGDLFQVFPVELDEIAKISRIAGFTGRGRLLAIDPPFDINRPFLCVLPTKECLIDIFSFSSDLDPPRA
jgi:hypothetical protein